MQKITILLCIALACCLLACERQMTPLLPPDDLTPGPIFEDPTPTPPPLVILYPRYASSSPDCVYETVDMLSIDVEAFISKSSPKEVILKVMGHHSNGCVSGIESRAYYQVDDRTITVWATKHVANSCICTTAVVPIGIAIRIGQLKAGEYKVVSQSGEQLLTFHTDNLGHMTINDCYSPDQDLPQIAYPDPYLDPGECL